MEIKCNGRAFTVTAKDRILDNGACYQLITQTYYKGFEKLTPIVSKTLFNRLLKSGAIQLSDQKRKGFGGGEYDLYEFMERS